MVDETCISFPFGDGLACSGPGTDATEHHFTGKERDAESGLDYFGARYYASAAGRWVSPDWSAIVEPIPYAKLDYPQSLNLYAYVENNPLTHVDVDGHCDNHVSGSAATCVQDSTKVAGNDQTNANTQEAQKSRKRKKDTAGTIYNETSTLREDGKSVGPGLHNARVALAQVIDVNHSKEKVASPAVQDNMKYPPAAAAMADSKAAVSEASTAPNGTQGATHFFLSGGKTPTPDWVTQGKIVESFGPFPVVANTHDFNKGQSATIQVIQYPAPKQ